MTGARHGAGWPGRADGRQPRRLTRGGSWGIVGGMTRHGLAFLLVAAALALAPLSAQAACRLALVLALDVSSSVDPSEDRLQRRGLAAALVAPDVQAAILADPDFHVALHVFEWSGRYQQSTLLDWRMLRTPEDIADAAAALAESSRGFANFPTALGYALGHAWSQLNRAPACDRKTVDVSGDGRNNAGFGPPTAFRHFDFSDITVNGLAIGGLQDGLPDYYRDEVIHGPGAFVEIATDFGDFQRAMERKLIRETASPQLGALPPASEPHARARAMDAAPHRGDG